VSINLPKLSLNLPNRHQNLAGQKRPNCIWLFFKNEKYSKKLNKAKNYKPGLKKAKLATLMKTPHDTAPSVKHAEQHVTLFPVQKSCFPAVGSLEPQPVC